MKEGQDAIYFVAADSVEKGEKSPFVEALMKKDYEVGGRAGARSVDPSIHIYAPH